MKVFHRSIIALTVIAAVLTVIFRAHLQWGNGMRSGLRLVEDDDTLWEPIRHGGRFDDIAAALRRNPSLVKQRIGGSTPLYWCAQMGRNDVAQLLLGMGADPNDKVIGQWAGEGETPLAPAVMSKNRELVAMLIQKGARTDVRDAYGITLLKEANDLGCVEIAELLRTARPSTQNSSVR